MGRAERLLADGVTPASSWAASRSSPRSTRPTASRWRDRAVPTVIRLCTSLRVTSLSVTGPGWCAGSRTRSASSGTAGTLSQGPASGSGRTAASVTSTLYQSYSGASAGGAGSGARCSRCRVMSCSTSSLPPTAQRRSSAAAVPASVGRSRKSLAHSASTASIRPSGRWGTPRLRSDGIPLAARRTRSPNSSGSLSNGGRPVSMKCIQAPTP